MATQDQLKAAQDGARHAPSHSRLAHYLVPYRLRLGLQAEMDFSESNVVLESTDMTV